MYRRKATPAVFISERVHKRAYHSERFRGAHSAKAAVTAQGLHRHERKTSRDKPGGAALDIRFGSSGHTAQLLFERLLSYYLQILRKNAGGHIGKCCHYPATSTPFVLAA